MEQKLGRVPAFVILLASSAAAFFLRLNQLAAGMDETGRMVAGAGKGFFTWFCVAMAAVFAVYSFFLHPRKKYHATAAEDNLTFCLTLAAAAAMVVGRVATVFAMEQITDVLLATGGVVTAICWVVVGLDRVRDRKVPAALFMAPALIYAVELICEFRFWSRDPQILDYCFELLALISVMCATFHLGGFCFDKGKRRMSVFFAFCGVFFSAASMADGGFGDIMVHAAAILWLLANLIPLLRPARKRSREEEEA